MKFHVSNVCSAFTPAPVGTKVTDAGAFTAAYDDEWIVVAG